MGDAGGGRDGPWSATSVSWVRLRRLHAVRGLINRPRWARGVHSGPMAREGSAPAARRGAAQTPRWRRGRLAQ